MNEVTGRPVQAHDFAADIADIGRIEALPTLLDVICRTTGMGFAAVARVTEDRWVACAVRDEIAFGLQPGGELQVATTLCREIRQTRSPVMIDDAAEDPTYCGHPTPALYGFQSYVSVPIVLPDDVFWGTLCAIDPQPHRVDTPETRDLFRAFAGLIATHLDVLQRAAADVARREQQAFQLTLERRLQNLIDPVAMMEVATEALGRHLGVDQVGFGELDATQTHVSVYRDWSGGRIASVVGTWRLDDFGVPFAAQLRAGGTVAVGDVRADPLTAHPDVVAAYEGIGTLSLLDVPHLRAGRMVAMLFLHHAEPRAWTPAEIALVEETCARLWSALERARAEARLRESEAQLTAIFANASVGLSEVDSTGRFLRVNAELCRILGRPAEEVLALGVADVTWPDDLAPSFAAVGLAIETGRATSLDKRYVRPDGTLIWANSSIQRLDDRWGNLKHLLVVTADINARKVAEEALRTSEEFNRRVLASSADCVKVLDLDARLEFMSEGGMCVMEVDDFGAVAGVCWLDLWPGDHHPDALAAIEAARRGGTGRFQGGAPTLKGSPRWWDVIVTPMAGSDGVPEKLLSISRDITAIKQAEAALRESEERFRTILNTVEAAFAIVEVKFDGDDRPVDYRFVEANPAFERQAGVNLRGKWVTEFAPDLERFWFDAYGHVAKTGEPASFENYAAAFERWFDVRAVRIGKPEERRIAILFNDVTERRSAQKALHESETRFRALVTAGAQTVYRMSPDWQEMRALDGAGFLTDTGSPDMRWLDAYIDPEDRPGVMDAIADAIHRRDVFELEHRVRRADGGFGWVLSRAVPILDAHGAIVEWFGAANDVTERVQAEERQEVLNHELSHRLKNTLTMVTSIARQTLRTVSDREPVEAFERRVQALASAHDLLLRTSWASASLRAVCEDVLSTTAPAGRLVLDGPDIAMGPSAALSASLLLHELATNAAKYGSLSSEAGRVEVRWFVEAGAGTPDLVLHWQERGGPPVKAPTSKGFGSRLIRMGLGGAGGVEVDYSPDGVRATMRAPLHEVQRS